MNKKLIRKQILKQRQSMSKNDVISKSIKIIDTLIKLDFYKLSEVIMTYVNFRNEVITKDLIVKSLETKRIIIPKTIPQTKNLILSELKDYENDLDIGMYGILEPKKEFIRPVFHNIIDLIIVPGAAFDVKGNRVGYGGGYYDRFFENLNKSIPKIALAFDFQIINEISTDEYDVKMDYIITEDKIIKCN